MQSSQAIASAGEDVATADGEAGDEGADAADVEDPDVGLPTGDGTASCSASPSTATNAHPLHSKAATRSEAPRRTFVL
jgi:hypothetical protein